MPQTMPSFTVICIATWTGGCVLLPDNVTCFYRNRWMHVTYCRTSDRHVLGSLFPIEASDVGWRCRAVIGSYSIASNSKSHLPLYIWRYTWISHMYWDNQTMSYRKILVSPTKIKWISLKWINITQDSLNKSTKIANLNITQNGELGYHSKW